MSLQFLADLQPKAGLLPGLRDLVKERPPREREEPPPAALPQPVVAEEKEPPPEEKEPSPEERIPPPEEEEEEMERLDLNQVSEGRCLSLRRARALKKAEPKGMLNLCAVCKASNGRVCQAVGSARERKPRQCVAPP